MSQYDFNTKYITVNLPSNKEYHTGIAGPEKISNPFKTVNIYANTNIREIGYVAPRQEKNRGRKSALRNHPKFPQSDPNPSTLNVTKPTQDDELTTKTLLKSQLRDAV